MAALNILEDIYIPETSKRKDLETLSSTGTNSLPHLHWKHRSRPQNICSVVDDFMTEYAVMCLVQALTGLRPAW